MYGTLQFTGYRVTSHTTVYATEEPPENAQILLVSEPPTRRLIFFRDWGNNIHHFHLPLPWVHYIMKRHEKYNKSCQWSTEGIFFSDERGMHTGVMSHPPLPNCLFGSGFYPCGKGWGEDIGQAIIHYWQQTFNNDATINRYAIEALGTGFTFAKYREKKSGSPKDYKNHLLLWEELHQDEVAAIRWPETVRLHEGPRCDATTTRGTQCKLRAYTCPYHANALNAVPL